MTTCGKTVIWGKTIRRYFWPKRTSQNDTIRQVSVHNFSVRDSIQHFFYYWLRTKYTTVNFFIFSTIFISQDVLNLMSIDLQFSMLVCHYVIHPLPLIFFLLKYFMTPTKSLRPLPPPSFCFSQHLLVHKRPQTTQQQLMY